MPARRPMVGIDECPVRGCRAHVPGVDPGELFEGSDYECARGHRLIVAVHGRHAWMIYEPVRRRGVCPACGKACRIRLDGACQAHPGPAPRHGKLCLGTGVKAARSRG